MTEREYPIHVLLDDGREFLVESLDPVVASARIGGEWLQARAIVWPTLAELLTSICSRSKVYYVYGEKSEASGDQPATYHVYRFKETRE